MASRYELRIADDSILRDVGLLAAMVFGVDPLSGYWSKMVQRMGTVQSLSDLLSEPVCSDSFSHEEELAMRIKGEWDSPDPETHHVVARINAVLSHYQDATS